MTVRYPRSLLVEVVTPSTCSYLDHITTIVIKVLVVKSIISFALMVLCSSLSSLLVESVMIKENSFYNYSYYCTYQSNYHNLLFVPLTLLSKRGRMIRFGMLGLDF